MSGSESDIIGQEIDGFRIDGVLGRGGMGAVYRAENRMLGRTVAIKIFDKAMMEQDELARRFRVEARVMARLSHPNIVRAYELRESSLGLYIVMEYVQGRTLSEYLHVRGPMPWQQAVPLIRQILSALAYAHREGVIHRDIKGRNLMLTPEGKIKVMDFGLAKVLQTNQESMTKTMSRGGTLYYMSPEQVRSLKNVDHRTDIYSLGMTLYQLLSGRLPFDKNDSAFTILRAIVEQPFPPPHEFNTLLPPGVDAFVLKALEKDPAKRYQRAEEMLTALDELEASVSSATLVLPQQPVRTPPPRRESTAVSAAPADPPRRSSSKRAERRAALLATRKKQKQIRYAILLAGLLVVAVASAFLLPGLFSNSPRVVRVPTTGGSGEQQAGERPAGETEQALPTANPGARQGQLRMRVQPWGYLSVDGEPKQQVDDSGDAILDLPAGSHLISITHPSHGRWEEEVRIPAGDVHSIDVDLEQEVTLRLTTSDTQGQLVRGVVFVDGEAQGTVPRDLRLSTGLHHIEVRKQGFRQSHIREDGGRPRMFRGTRPAINLDRRSEGATLTVHLQEQR